MSKGKKSGRSWWRELFVDHPGFAAGDSNAFAASSTGITKASKVYCAACLPVDVQDLLQDDYSAINQGRITVPRDQAVIEAYCELISRSNTIGLGFIAHCTRSVGQTADESWSGRIHSLCRFHVSQPPQVLFEPTATHTAACKGWS